MSVKTQAIIPVTSAELPPIASYTNYLQNIWENHRLTNQGPLAQQLEADLNQYLGASTDSQLTSSGTTALQLAIRALNLSGEVITTPFSFVATTAAILWERCQPVFVDIDPHTFCLDAAKIEAAITPRTQAILATHVYGYPCDVERIEAVAQRYNLKVIYDGAHAFGTRIQGRSVLTYGDVTACSFHATKLFHTGEGGAVITRQPEVARRVGLLRAAGLVAGQPQILGTNAKLSELHAALGLCLLPGVEEAIRERAKLHATYRVALAGLDLCYPALVPGTTYNYAYFPVVLSSEAVLLRVQKRLAAAGIGSRRYFFPSLNCLPYHTGESCPISEDLAGRVLCLPFFRQLQPEQAKHIADLVRAEVAAAPTAALAYI
ncbi:MAG: DegT/DnrJ/EryC1/StrS family aminotransferase [Janthinobacterium lividum]